MDDDLISRKALKEAVENLVAGGAERLKDYYENGSKLDEREWIGGVYDAWELINDAPTITPDMALFLAYESGKASAEAKTITPGGRYNGKRALSLLSEIEKIARDAFNDPETLDINLYRAQALARIFQLFEYNNEEAADNGEQGSN